MERNKANALNAKFRDKNYPYETPEEYVIRKMEALTMLSDWTDSELITEIMNSAPEHWSLYIDSSIVTTWDDFLDKVSWHEDKLLHHNGAASNDLQQQLSELNAMLRKLENDEHSDANTHRSNQEAHEYRSDNTYARDNESESDEESSEHNSYRALKSFAVSRMNTPTPKRRDVMPGGDTWDLSNTKDRFVQEERNITYQPETFKEALKLEACRSHLDNQFLLYIAVQTNDAGIDFSNPSGLTNKR
ncbi:hypothetical protein RSAG8_13633, partial [Rhizoctonia solani AG-8 WAC10335]